MRNVVKHLVPGVFSVEYDFAHLVPSAFTLVCLSAYLVLHRAQNSAAGQPSSNEGGTNGVEEEGAKQSTPPARDTSRKCRDHPRRRSLAQVCLPPLPRHATLIFDPTLPYTPSLPSPPLAWHCASAKARAYATSQAIQQACPF